MKITIQDERNLDNIPSGSGIIKSVDNYFIIGDDSPYLFFLDKDFKIISKTALFDTDNFLDERIVKSKKPDFEAIELIDQNEIVIFGSGSKSPHRNIFFRILLQDPLIIEKYDISYFYSQLKGLPVFSDSELNIEACAYSNDRLYLFNRNKNLILDFEYSQLLAHLSGEVEFPEVGITQFILPKIGGLEAGFSGAATLKKEEKIIFTASVENTDNSYDDGEILGSIIGVIDISNSKVSESFVYCAIPNSGANLKVESVTIDEEISSGETKVVLITDDDQGNSILLIAIIEW